MYTGTYNYILTGRRYEFFVRQYLKFFKKKNIKIVLFEDFIKDLCKICKEILDFIHVPFREHFNYQTISNVGNMGPVDNKAMIEIRKLDIKI